MPEVVVVVVGGSVVVLLVAIGTKVLVGWESAPSCGDEPQDTMRHDATAASPVAIVLRSQAHVMAPIMAARPA